MTRRQRDLLDFITAYVARERIPPTLREMAKGIGVKSSGKVHALLTGLAEQGYVSWIRARKQILQVPRQPGDKRPFCPKCGRVMVVAAAGERWVREI